MRIFIRFLLASLFLIHFEIHANTNDNDTISEPMRVLTLSKNVISKAQKAWGLTIPLQNETIEQTKKGAFCALGEDVIDFEFVSSSLFGRIYDHAEEETKSDIEDSLLNNYAHVFLEQIGEKINYTYDWENVKIESENFGRSKDRTEGYSVEVTTWKPEYDNLPEGSSKPTSSVKFEFIKDSHSDTFKIVDLILAGARVSKFYAAFVQNIRRRKNTLEEVLDTWAKESIPLCPEDTAPYAKLLE
ncbi:MAG: hypothetical protein KDD58_06060 [Bdellovibrionales bacterium]|nr:hypothetical protein [Bdellovibrionales bacterium]